MIDEVRPTPVRGFLRPALLLAGSLCAVALLLLPFAITRTGSGSVSGLVVAGLVCLLAGWIAEVVAYALDGRVAPVGIMALGMAIRVLPPMAVCIGLLANGEHGRDHLAFIVYLLTFYFTTLAVETIAAVKRLGATSVRANQSAG